MNVHTLYDISFVVFLVGWSGTIIGLSIACLAGKIC